MGADPLRVADVYAYMEINQVHPDMRKTWLDCILALEGEWLGWARKKQAEKK